MFAWWSEWVASIVQKISIDLYKRVVHCIAVHAFDVLGDPVRRRILELLSESDRDLQAGAIAAAIIDEFGISQPAVSQHLKVLRDAGFATMRPDGQRRLYSVDTTGFQEADAWIQRYRHMWLSRLDALDTELRRGRKARRDHKEKD